MQIIVLGMHRSGTSLLSRILNLLDCYFGTEEVTLARQADNPKGFWERTDVMMINDYILNAAGGSWWDAESLDFSSISRTNLAYIHKQVGDIVLKMDAHRPWFIKDPRLCLTLNYWIPFLECPIFLVSSRSPIQSARSLTERNNIPIEYSLLLWEFYMASMFQNLGNFKYHHVEYEQILKTPFDAVKRVYELLLASGVSGLRLPNRSEVEAFVDGSLCHYHDENVTRLVLSDTQQSIVDALRKDLPAVIPCKQKILSNIVVQKKKGGNWIEKLIVSLQQEKQEIFKKTNISPASQIVRLEARYADLEARYADLEARYTDLEARYADLEAYQRQLSQKWWVRPVLLFNRLLGRDHRLDPHRKRA